MRSIRELEALALYDGRFYRGTIKDWGPQGNDGIWGAVPPEFKRSSGHVVGLEYDLNIGNQAVTTPGLTTSGSFTYEISMFSRSAGAGTFGRIIEPTTATCVLRWNGGNIRFDCGTAWDLVLSSIGTMHLVATRDDSNDGHLYRNGVLQGSSAVGADNLAGTTLRFGNRGALNTSFDGHFYVIRVFDTYITSEEAALLYEHSRIQLQPGAPKRSGIMSVR